MNHWASLDRPIHLPFGRTLARGAVGRCPVCGSRGLIRRWFGLAERCPRCGIVVERIDGFRLGALGLNTMIVVAAMFVVVVVGVFSTAPDVAVAPVMTAALVIAVVGPVLLLPTSRTLWLGIDLLLRPPEEGEFDATVRGVRPRAHR